MSTNNYEIQLRGPGKEAAAAALQIGRKMLSYATEGELIQLQYAYSILKQMCRAMTANGTNYDVYCDIFVGILSPNVDPTASSKLWGYYLEMVRYFYCLLSERKQYPAMSTVYDWLARKPCKLQNASDYEFIVNIYVEHLMAQSVQGRKCEDTRIANIYTEIELLFVEMLEKNKKENFTYNNLIKNVIGFLVPKSSQYMCRFLAKTAPNSTSMFEALFKLLGELREPQIGLEETKTLFVDYMSALMVFRSIDAASTQESTEQIALRFMRVCRELAVFKKDKTIAYAICLVYYLLKAAFSQNAAKDYATGFVDVIDKFRIFLQRFGTTLKGELWFKEYIVAMSLLLSQLELNVTNVFNIAIKKEERSSDLSGVKDKFFMLLLDITQLAPNITQTQLISSLCCKSPHKHLMFSLLQTALKHCVSTEDQEPVSSNDPPQFHRTLVEIMRHSVGVIKSMACINSSAPDLISFHTLLKFVLSKTTRPTEVRLCVTVMEALLDIRTVFTANMWLQLLQRLRRAATAATKDAKLIADMYAIHIASMLKLNNSDYPAVLHLIGVFYTSEQLTVWDMCLLEILEASRSPLKPTLELQEKRMLHSMEAQIVFKYQRANILLHTSLLKCSHTNLDFVLIAREASNQLNTIGKLQRIYKSLHAKELYALKRIEKLTLAHTCTLLASEENEKMKKLVECPLKDFAEENFDDLVLKDKIKCINVERETKVINLIWEAVNWFEQFYYTADVERIPSIEVLIDWEAVIADVSLLARLLQLRGYLEQAGKAWVLHYRISNFLGDSNNVLRSLAFFCEHAAHFDHSTDINLAQEASEKVPVILNTLHALPTLVPRRQNYVLLCLCQLAYYYARGGNFNYASLLLRLTEMKRDELPERYERFDFVLATIQAVKFRILWKLVDDSGATDSDGSGILRQIEFTFNRFRGFVQITSEDSLNYMTLLFGLMQEFAECTINRLCDNILKNYYVTILKAALETGAALRIVQCLISWSLANLQMECVDKANLKIKVVEHFLGVKDLYKPNADTMLKKEQKVKPYLDHGILNYIPSLEQFNTGMEPRRVAPVQLSPVMKDTLRLTTGEEFRDLQRFLSHDSCEILSKYGILQWAYTTTGVISARLYFLTNQFATLEQFYEKLLQWCANESNILLLQNFQNVQLISRQHCMNYLRAHDKCDRALEVAESALIFSRNARRNVDKLYHINLELQRQSTKRQMLQMRSPEHKLFRRALEFRLSPEDKKRIAAKNMAQKLPAKHPKTSIYTRAKKPGTKNGAKLKADYYFTKTIPNHGDEKSVNSEMNAAFIITSTDDSDSNSSSNTHSVFSTPNNKESTTTKTSEFRQQQRATNKVRNLDPKCIRKEASGGLANASASNKENEEVVLTVMKRTNVMRKNAAVLNAVCPTNSEIIHKMNDLSLNPKQQESIDVIDSSDSPSSGDTVVANDGVDANNEGILVIHNGAVKKRGRPKRTEAEKSSQIVSVKSTEPRKLTRRRQQT